MSTLNTFSILLFLALSVSKVSFCADSNSSLSATNSSRGDKPEQSKYPPDRNTKTAPVSQLRRPYPNPLLHLHPKPLAALLEKQAKEIEQEKNSYRSDLIKPELLDEYSRQRGEHVDLSQLHNLDEARKHTLALYGEDIIWTEAEYDEKYTFGKSFMDAMAQHWEPYAISVYYLYFYNILWFKNKLSEDIFASSVFLLKKYLENLFLLSRSKVDIPAIPTNQLTSMIFSLACKADEQSIDLFWITVFLGEVSPTEPFLQPEFKNREQMFELEKDIFTSVGNSVLLRTPHSVIAVLLTKSPFGSEPSIDNVANPISGDGEETRDNQQMRTKAIGIASFFLESGLMNASLIDTPLTLVAVASASLAFQFFHKDKHLWPESISKLHPYTLSDVDKCAATIVSWFCRTDTPSCCRQIITKFFESPIYSNLETDLLEFMESKLS